MKMFRLFEKKENAAMTVYILSLMNTYLEQCKGDIVLVKEEPGLANELVRLKNLGLGNSENAKLLKMKIKELEDKKESSKFGQEVFEFIKELRSIFPKSYLISFDQFYDILKRYKLTVGKINNYTGIIPQKNIDEISEVIRSIEKNVYDCKYVLNHFVRDNRNNELCNMFYYVNKIELRRGNNEYKKLANKLKKVLASKGFLLKYPRFSQYGVSSIDLKEAISYNEWINNEEFRTRGSDDIYLGVSRLDYRNLMIAAPENSFSEKFKITQMPVDPIVFQCCPYGVVIHSVWGEEADDKVLEEYKTLNQKILDL